MSGYEILKDGKVIGFTSTNTFVDEDATLDESFNYEVIPYDIKLNQGKSSYINSHSPIINLSQEKIIIKLGEEFNAKDYVKALNYKGENITENVVIEDNVDNTKKGTYKVTYSVNHKDINVSKTIDVEVVSNYDYLSDYEWESTKTQYGNPRRNNNIKLRVNNEIKTFEKGMGIHANGEIVYDLGNHNYDTFEALVGVDMTIPEQDRSSISFEIVADGKVLDTTNIIKYKDNASYINVPIKGVKNLTIKVTDGGNGNSSDHAVIANPKLITNNSKPTLNIPKSITTELGKEVDLKGEFSATDIEDGDLTSKVEVIGDVNFDKSGQYPITYKVVDSDGNEVTKTRIISVLDYSEYLYLSDLDWKSTQNSYAQPKKDIATSGNPLRLTDEDKNIVTYQKGIGAHSTSTIVYDISNIKAGLFTSYVGVDRQMYGTVGSVSFEVYVDGEKRFDSGVMKSTDSQQYLQVDLSGAKELKLVVTDGGNNIGSDHATWGDAKIYTISEKTNFEELSNTLNQVNELNEYMYTTDSFTLLNAVVEKAKAIINNEDLSQEEVDSICEELKTAIKNLVERKEKKDLSDLIDYAETLDETMVGDISHKDTKWQNFINVKEQAKLDLIDSSKTLEETNSMIWFLQYTIDELKIN